MKIMTVVGARPNFMKAAPIVAAIRKHNEHAENRGGAPIEHILLHTGQHYDPTMSDSFFADLNLPAPDVRLEVGSASNIVQTAEVLKRLEAVLLRERPDAVIVVGDVNSTLASALATAKISFDTAGTRPLLAHVEAGLRSFDGSMPEEINRIVTDHVADLLFVTEESAVRNLRSEGVAADKIHFVGNTMIDSLLMFKDKADSTAILEKLDLRAPAGSNGDGAAVHAYSLLTLHRPSNVDDRDAFLNILAGLEELAAACPVVFPVHPRTRQRIREFGLERHFAAQKNGHGSGMILTEPLGYLEFICLMKHAALVVTDSGGIQEETTCLGVPCVTVRENTERPVTIEMGTNVLAGTKPEGIRAAIRRQNCREGGTRAPVKWDGRAARRILDILIGAHCDRTPQRQAAVPQLCAS